MPRLRLQEGEILEGFTIGPLIHRGGMAMLHATTHPDHSLPLVMKLPLLFEGEDPAAIVSFEMEQMILPRLHGPHAPRFIASGDFSQQPFIVMERLPGTSLLARLADLPLPPGDIPPLAARIADALDAIHRQHVVHLDIKPSNILARENGAVVLIDYGLSHHAQLPDLMEEEFRLPYGTAPYMAPEQIMGLRDDPRSDLFALGALMYFFATGTRPFGDPQKLSGLKRRLWRDPVPPRALNPGITKPLQDIILRCLEVDPARRHPTAAQLALDLRTLDQLPLTARAEKIRQDGWRTTLRRRFNPEARPQFHRRRDPDHTPATAILAVAIDLADSNTATDNALRDTARALLATLPGARLACLHVLRQNRLAPDTSLDAEGENKHLKRLVALRAWAAPLALAEGRATFHVLEATDPAAALVDYATANGVDHLLLGARPATLKRRLLGGVTADVVQSAPCTLTIVRPRGAG